MSYNKLLVLSVALFIGGCANIFANEEAKKIKASLSDATVFFQGAELNHLASSVLQKGVNEIWITDLSPNVDLNSLKITASKGVVVTSFEYSQDFVNRKDPSQKEKNLKDSILFYKNRVEEYDISTKTNNDLLELLKANKTISGTETGLNVAELMKMVEYYGTKSNELNKAQSVLREKRDKAQQAMTRIQKQQDQEAIKNVKSMGILKLNLSSPLTTTADFVVTYYTPTASWSPYYDINVPSAGQEIQLASKAKVRQTTGLDWNKVKLALSTATPSKNKKAPLFDAWFLDFSHMYSSNKNRRGVAASLIQNSFSYGSADNYKLSTQRASSESAFASRSTEDATQINNTVPMYLINGVVTTLADVSSLSPDMIESTNVLNGDVATSLYGAQANNGVVQITTKTMDDFVQVNEGVLNAVYTIDLPYSIEGNGKVQNIDLKITKVPAELKHYSVPKLDNETFMLAEIADWQKLGLLSGMANVTYDGTYVGESMIDASSIAKQLALTLGADKRVVVKREKLQDFSSKKFLGKDVKQEFTYKITVKNNQNKTIKMTLKDQYPLTNQKEIEVELLTDKTTTPSYNNKQVGVLSWQFDLLAGETKEFLIAYTVKYPKDKPINLD